jgi:AbrB family looped-hinge helix DNA binding protein
MSRITSKMQVTIPKAVAAAYGLAPGDDIAFEPAGDVIRVRPPSAAPARQGLDRAERLRRFDEASQRIAERRPLEPTGSGPRGWTREELYDRGLPA